MICDNCGIDSKIEAIYQNRNGDTFAFCEQCISKIDFSNIDTYKWFFEILDIPYIPQKMNKIISFFQRYRSIYERCNSNIKNNILRMYQASIAVTPQFVQSYNEVGEPICRHCLQNKGFYCYKNKFDVSFYFCKDCMSKIKITDINSYKWFLKMLNIPYYQDMIDNTIQYYKQYRPEKQRTPERILRNYLAKMKLASFKPFGFNDSIRFNKGE